MKRLKYSVLFFSTILAYVIFHITEEALGNFPLFMHQNWGIPNIGYARWLYHNIIFFLPVLMIGFLMYLIDEKRIYLGLGITFWGILNFFEHTFYTIKNGVVSPGFFSSLIFVALAILTMITLAKQKNLTKKIVISSVLTAGVYWLISIALVLTCSQLVAKIFQ
ncbi:hypothetical protein [Leptolinea tardivitalis]|uniref:HXXEE domain-containing protein n=1 Tax=Leptolinea tardivitalis TaxID=229920 RepID=A0A0P6X1U6_9CHLR|nr:hypothetical protein [Leptolinea tardivitalis]KPL73384.1 hypothetical protein ADM99_04015 [Leptolinea tardivitalis]GAP21526.1 hypothetical protein LTAR_01737 [Leptolinea tardivitalis]